jgi:hypothetical protein
MIFRLLLLPLSIPVTVNAIVVLVGMLEVRSRDAFLQSPTLKLEVQPCP